MSEETSTGLKRLTAHKTVDRTVLLRIGRKNPDSSTESSLQCLLKIEPDPKLPICRLSLLIHGFIIGQACNLLSRIARSSYCARLTVNVLHHISGLYHVRCINLCWGAPH